MRVVVMALVGVMMGGGGGGLGGGTGERLDAAEHVRDNMLGRAGVFDLVDGRLSRLDLDRRTRVALGHRFGAQPACGHYRRFSILHRDVIVIGLHRLLRPLRFVGIDWGRGHVIGTLGFLGRAADDLDSQREAVRQRAI